MLRLPRTTAPPRRSGGQPTDTGGGEASPTAVLTGLPLPKQRAHKQQAVIRWNEGHAKDIVQLLNQGWFGAEERMAEDEEPPPPPRSRKPRAQQQQQVQAQQQQILADGSTRWRGPDASPSTSGSHRSGGSAGGASALPRASMPQAILSRQQQAQAAAVQELPGIGTWAGRYRLFGPREQPVGTPDTPQLRQGQAEEQQPPVSPLAAHQRTGSDGEAAAAEVADMFGSPVVLRVGGLAGGSAHGRRSGPQSYNSDQAREEVWRWRFSRKWASEQQKFYEGDGPASVVSDDLDAMAFTQACGTGVNLQLLPTSAQRASVLGQSSDGGPRPLESCVSGLSLFDVDASYQPGLLGAEMSPGCSTHGAIAAGYLLQRTSSNASTGGCGGGHEGMAALPPLPPLPPHRSKTAPQLAARSPAGPSATRSVLSMASRARDLMQKQQAIEAAEQDRWDRSATAGDAWAGRHLEPVRVSMTGRFRYYVLRISAGLGHTRFLVRGRAGASAATLVQEVEAEARAASRAAGVPAATVEVVGDGVMEWREDTERELYLAPSMVPGEGLAARSGNGDSPTKASNFLGDVTGLTASLVRQALPCHFRITTAASASRSSSAATLGGNRI